MMNVVGETHRRVCGRVSARPVVLGPPVACGGGETRRTLAEPRHREIVRNKVRVASVHNFLGRLRKWVGVDIRRIVAQFRLPTKKTRVGCSQNKAPRASSPSESLFFALGRGQLGRSHRLPHQHNRAYIDRRSDDSGDFQTSVPRDGGAACTAPFT